MILSLAMNDHISQTVLIHSTKGTGLPIR